MKILLFKIGAIGDTLMTTPLIRQLRNNFPDAQIDYLVGKSSFQILEDNPNLSTIIPFDENIYFKHDFLKYIQLIKEIRKKLYDVIFVLDKHGVFNLTAKLFGIRERIGFDRLGREGFFLTHKVLYGPVRHEIIYYLNLADRYGISVNYKDLKMDLIINPNIKLKIKNMLFEKGIEDYVVLINSGGNNCGECSKIRKLPDELFRGLVARMAENSNVIFIGGTDERLYYEKFVLNDNCFNFAGQTSIKESAAILKYAKKVVTSDSGPMHMASAVNDNIISIFGPTNPDRKAPSCKNCISIWKDQDIYDENYELYGKIPKNKSFFKRIKIEDVV